MIKAPSRSLLVAAAVVVFAVVAGVAGAANNAGKPGVHNGVITACVEPLTKGNRYTSGDLNFLVCLKGAKRISWNIKGPKGPKGPAGKTGAQGPAGPAERTEGRQVPLARRGGEPGAAAGLGGGETRPAGGAAEFGVVSVFVDRGNGPSRLTTLSVGLRLAGRNDHRGTFRFTCTAAQAP